MIITPETRQVRLQVNFSRGDYDSYGVTLKAVGGPAIWTKTGLKAQSRGTLRVISVSPPAGIFSTEDYILTLTGQTSAGAEDLSEYFFSVSKMSKK